MPYVIAKGCNKDGLCLAECATDSIQEGVFVDANGVEHDQMFIDPETCIECGNCELVCENHAIYADADLPADQANYAEINHAFFAQK